MFSVRDFADSQISVSTARSADYSQHPAAHKLFRWASAIECIIMAVGAHTPPLNFDHFIKEHEGRAGNYVQVLLIYIIVGIPAAYMQVLIGQYTHLSIFFIKRMVPIAHGICYVHFLSIFASSICSVLIMETLLLYLIISLEPSGYQWMFCALQYQNVCWGVNKRCCLTEHVHLAAYQYWNFTFMGGTLPVENTTIGAPEIQRLWASMFAWILIYLITLLEFTKLKEICKGIIVVTIVARLLLTLNVVLIMGPKETFKLVFRIDLPTLLNLSAWKESVTRVVKTLVLGDFTYIMFGVFCENTMRTGSLICFYGIINLYLYLNDVLLIGATTSYLLRHANLPPEKQYLLFLPPTTNMIVGVVPTSIGHISASSLWTTMYFLIGCSSILTRVVIDLVFLQKSLFQKYPTLSGYYKYISPLFCATGFGFGCILESKESYEILRDVRFLITEFCDHINVFILSFIVTYIYGFMRFRDDIHFMMGTAPTKFWKITWMILPVLIAWSTPVDYIDYEHPLFLTRIIIIGLMFSPYLIMCPIEMIKKVIARQLISLFRPEPLWGPADPERREMRQVFNPRHETRYTQEVYVCKHKCLRGNKHFQKVQEEEKTSQTFILVN